MNRNEIFAYVKKLYGTEPEYLWADTPNNAVLRNAKNQKWYAIIMDVPACKLGLAQDGVVDILDIKCEPDMVSSLLNSKGFLPAYHMNKKHWITLLLDGTIPDHLVLDYLDWSYDLVDIKAPRQITKHAISQSEGGNINDSNCSS